jgi:CIC family chloride channel protein
MYSGMRPSFHRAGRLVRLHWFRLLRVREHLSFSEEAFHLLLAGGVGVLGGLVNLLHYRALDWVERLFLHRAGDPVEVAEMMGRSGRLLLPALGGLVAGLVLYWGLRLVGPQGSTNLLEVVVAGDGKLPLRSSLIKFISSLVSLGTGGSLGREGGIVQMSATLASKTGQLANWPPYRLRLLVGCGAASGIAAAYNAPVAGAVFAALIVLGNFSMNHFGPLVFSSVIATLTTRSFSGIKSWYAPVPFEFSSVGQLPWFLLLGAVCGGVGAVFLKLLRFSDQAFIGMKTPVYVRLTLGGLIVGVLALWYPGVWGNGYLVTNRILQGREVPGLSPLIFLAGLWMAKLVATLATVGSGAVGGVFTPTLFLGAGLGAGFGLVLHQAGWAAGLPVTAFALVGMGGLLSATTRSPLLAMIMIFEISMDYSIMPPLMLVCVVSVLVARRIHSESIYTGPLRHKGLEAMQETTRPGTATARTVGDLMGPPVDPVLETDSFKELAERFLTVPYNFLPVVNAQRQLTGLVALQDLKEHLNSGGELIAVIASDVMRPARDFVTPRQRLLDTLPVVLGSELRNIPVVSSSVEKTLVGALSRAQVLNLFSEAIAASKPTGL